MYWEKVKQIEEELEEVATGGTSRSQEDRQ